MVPSVVNRCIEKKILLSGKVHEYPCHLILLRERFGILRYVLDKEYVVGNEPLHAGDVTYALYWVDRPYTLYTWRHVEGTIYYFNIADSVSLTLDTFLWRDLALDILVDAQKIVHVLDEHELPPDLPRELRAYIERAKILILGNYHEIIREADLLLEEFTA